MMFCLQTRTLETNSALVIEELVPPPLSLQRQWYLYDKIRDLVNDESKKDIVAPRSTQPLSRVSDQSAATKRKNNRSISKRKRKAESPEDDPDDPAPVGLF